ncbi:hypothetical protein Q7P37_002862 [Cladosporium fusiforme]
MYLLAFTFLFGAVQALLVPAPPGPYSVAVKHFELLDNNRMDPLAPKPDSKRRFMASAYLPIDAAYHCESEMVPYMPALTASIFGPVGATLGAPQDMLEQFDMEFCNISTIDAGTHVQKREFPIAIFSPGLGGSRLLYGALARSLASLGHIVFTIDHTYETYVVEFPDGTAANTTLDLATFDTDNKTATLKLVEVRAADMSFLASQLSNETFKSSVLAEFPDSFNPRKVAAYGHSLGGATAVLAAQHDPLVIGGLDFDGTIYGDVQKQGLKAKPFVLVASTRPQNIPLPSWPGWDSFYDHVDAAKMELFVQHTEHYAFMDVPLLLTVYQVPAESQPALDEAFGTLSGRKLERAQNEIMGGLLDLLFNNRTMELEVLDRNADMSVVRSNLTECI